MRNSRVLVIFLAVLIGLVFSASAGAEVFINDFPVDMTCNAGQPLDVPLFFVGGSNVGKPIELFIWKEGLQSGSKEYYSASGWVPFTDLSNMQALGSLDAMIEYAHVVWQALGNTTGVESFKLSVCMDSVVDNVFALDTSVCGQRAIEIIVPENCEGFTATPTVISEALTSGQTKAVDVTVRSSCDKPIMFTANASNSWIKIGTQTGLLTITLDSTGLQNGINQGSVVIKNAYGNVQTINVTLTVSGANQNCTGINVTPASITKSLQRGNSETVQLSVKDSCNQPISFSAAASQSWITLTNQQGISNATLNAASLSPGSYSGVITFTSGSSSKTVNVALTVTAPGFDFGGGCTPSSISVWPVNITAESGATKTATTSVANNCGTAVSYSASVTSGSPWLTVSTPGTGTVTVTVNTAGKAAGTYYGTITISSSGLTSATLNVTLTVTGPCTPSTVEVNPASISSTVFKGSNASDVSVTVKDNCGNNLAFAITGVTSGWTDTAGATGEMTAPALGNGNGSFVARFHTDDLAAGTYTGSIALDATLGTATISKSIPVSVRVTQTSGSTTASLIQNGKKYFFGISPGEIKYFYFIENSDKGTGNVNELIVDLADMIQTNQYNVDMVIRYSGPTCDDSKKPTMADRTNLFSGVIHSGGPEGFYASMTGTAMETNLIKRNASINPEAASPYANPEGCYYVMVVNVDVGSENQLRIGYTDYNSNPGL
ncbi:MAG: BACON domain-containing protein [Nitrospirae bacterium]|nr:BACON domain-containing protein [Nitrospirota bacterium]